VSSSLPRVARWRRAVIRSELSDAQVRVAVALADHMNGAGSPAWPSVERLAKLTHRSPRSVQRALRELEEAGWIEATSSRKGGRAEGGDGRATRYRATFPKGDTDDTLQGRHSRRARVTETAAKGDTDDTRSREEVEREVVPPDPPRGKQTQARADAQDRLAALDIPLRAFDPETDEELER
jgi:DNA-binding transcriptional ArsR family regulator